MNGPRFADLARAWASGHRGRWDCGPISVHPDPRFWKYHWWVFHRGSPCEGDAFLGPAHRLGTHDAMRLMQELDARGELYWVYQERLPRRDPVHTLFDVTAPRWNNRLDWAPPLDQDGDPAWEGHR